MLSFVVWMRVWSRSTSSTSLRCLSRFLMSSCPSFWASCRWQKGNYVSASWNSDDEDGMIFLYLYFIGKIMNETHIPSNLEVRDRVQHTDWLNLWDVLLLQQHTTVTAYVAQQCRVFTCLHLNDVTPIQKCIQHNRTIYIKEYKTIQSTLKQQQTYWFPWHCLIMLC